MKLFNWDQKSFRRTAIFVMALVTLFILVNEIFGPNGYMTLRREKKEYTHLKQQVQTLSEQNQQLEQKIKALKDNPEAVEKQARDQLYLAKPGEIIYMLPDRTSAQPPGDSKQTSHAKGH
jgi:cell division protein FtsB